MGSQFTDIILKVLPVLILIISGLFLQRIRFFKPESISDIKKLVVNITLPSLLFLAFSQLELKAKLLIIPLMVFSVCIIMVLVGKLIAKILGIKTPYFPLMFGGFEAGMMGYSIYLAAYGIEQIDKFAIVDLGQVIFVFFILMSFLTNKRDGTQSPQKVFKMFATSPVIISILLGILTSALRTKFYISDTGLYQAVSQLLNMIGNITVPLICIVIGYELKFKFQVLKLPILTILFRTTILLIFAFIINETVLIKSFGFDINYKYALMTMFILPPPFVIPLFIKDDDEENRQYILSTLSLNTIFSLIIFVFVNILCMY